MGKIELDRQFIDPRQPLIDRSFHLLDVAADDDFFRRAVRKRSLRSLFWAPFSAG